MVYCANIGVRLRANPKEHHATSTRNCKNQDAGKSDGKRWRQNGAALIRHDTPRMTARRAEWLGVSRWGLGISKLGKASATCLSSMWEIEHCVRANFWFWSDMSEAVDNMRPSLTRESLDYLKPVDTVPTQPDLYVGLPWPTQFATRR